MKVYAGHSYCISLQIADIQIHPKDKVSTAVSTAHLEKLTLHFNPSVFLFFLVALGPFVQRTRPDLKGWSIRVALADVTPPVPRNKLYLAALDTGYVSKSAQRT